MNRRTFLCGLALGALSAPLAGEAQQAGKPWRIGLLANFETPGWEGLEHAEQNRQAKAPTDDGETDVGGRR